MYIILFYLQLFIINAQKKEPQDSLIKTLYYLLRILEIEELIGTGSSTKSIIIFLAT